MNTAGLYQAQKAVHGSSTDPSLRQEADRYLQTFRTGVDPLAVIETSLQLLNDAEGNDYSLHFALQCFQYVVLNSWNNLGDTHKDMVKQQLSMFARSKWCDITCTSCLQSNTVANVICDIATREWPQKWTEQLTQCESLSHSVSGAFLTMTFLKYFGAAIFTPSEALPNRRRSELQAGIQVSKQPQILLLKSIMDNIHIYCNSSSISVNVKNLLISVCMDTLLEFYPKLPFALLEEHHMVDYLSRYLMIPSVTGATLEVIISLVCHKNTTAVTFIPTIMKLWLQVLHCANEQLKHANEQDEDQEILMDKCLRAVKVFISTHSDNLGQAKRFEQEELASQVKEGTFYVQFQATKLAAMTTYALGCLNELIRLHLSKYVLEGPRQAELTLECLRIASGCMQKGESVDNDEISSKRANALILVDLVTLVRPAEAMVFVAEQVHGVAQLQQQGAVSVEQMNQINALVMVADDISKTVDQHIHLSPQFQQQADCSQVKNTVYKACESMLQKFASFQSMNMDYMTIKLRLQACTLPLLRNSPEALMVVIKACFEAVQLNPDDAMGMLDASKAVSRPAPLVDQRRRACYTLLQLSKKIAVSFSSLLLDLKAFLTTIQPNVIPSEYIYLLEFLLTVALSSEDKELQRKVLLAEIEPNLQTLQSGLHLDLFKSMLELQKETLQVYEAQLEAWKQWGDKPQPTFAAVNEKAKNERYNFFYCLNNLTAIARALRTGQESPVVQVSSQSTEDRQQLKASNSALQPTHTALSVNLHPLLNELVVQLLPTLLKFLAYSNMFMSDAMQAEQPANFVALATPTYQHMQYQMCIDAGVDHQTTKVPPRTHHILRDIGVWVSQCHELILQLLSCIASQSAIPLLLQEHKDQFTQVLHSFYQVPPRLIASFYTKFLSVLLQQASESQLASLLPISAEFFVQTSTQYAAHTLQTTTYPEYFNFMQLLGPSYLPKQLRLRGGDVRQGMMQHTHVNCNCIYMRLAAVLPLELVTISQQYNLSRVCPCLTPYLAQRQAPNNATCPAVIAPSAVQVDMARIDDKDAREALSSFAMLYYQVSNTSQHTQKAYDKINRSAQKCIAENEVWSGISGVTWLSSFATTVICDNASLNKILQGCFTLVKLHDQHSILLTCTFLRSLINTMLGCYARLQYAKNTGSALDVSLGPVLCSKNANEQIQIQTSLEASIHNSLISTATVLHHYTNTQYTLQEAAVEELGNIIRDIFIQTTATNEMAVVNVFSTAFAQPQQIEVLLQIAKEGDGVRGRQDWSKKIQAYLKNEENTSKKTIQDLTETFLSPPKEKPQQNYADVSKALAGMFK